MCYAFMLGISSHYLQQYAPFLHAAAIQTLVTVFVSIDPVAQRWWRCVNPEDKVCRAALASLKPDVCGLPRNAWQWTRR